MKTLLFSQGKHIIYIILFSLLIIKNKYKFIPIGFFLLSLFFFRDYEINETNDKLIMSPADGTIKKYEINNDYITTIIYLGLTNIHVQKAPIHGIITKIEYFKGTFHPAGLISKSTYNERCSIYMDTPFGQIKITLIAGVIARTIVLFVKENDVVKQGQNISMIKFGSRVDMTVNKQFVNHIHKYKYVSFNDVLFS